MKVKNITRYTYERTAFQGWRLSFCRSQRQFTRYFSDKAYGGEQQALAAALELREALLQALKENPQEAGAIFERFRSS